MTKEAPTMGETKALVLQYSALLYRHCYAMLGNREDAQDAVQETFLRYMRSAPEFKDEEHAKAWLLKVSMNLCRSQLRQRSRRETLPLEEAQIPAAVPVGDTPVLDRLTALPYKYKEVLLLHYIEGYKVREIAARLHLTQSTVKMRLQKGRQLLRESIKEEMR